MESCPICIDAVGDKCVWSCTQHKVCARCLYKLFEHQAITTCPLCRAPPETLFRVGFHGDAKYVWATNINDGEGNALVGNRQTGIAHMTKYNKITDLLDYFTESEILMAARTDEDGMLLYLAAGKASTPFFNLFQSIPPFTHEVEDARYRRRMIRELNKEVLAFCTADGLEDVTEFLCTYLFPVTMRDVEEDVTED